MIHCKIIVLVRNKNVTTIYTKPNKAEAKGTNLKKGKYKQKDKKKQKNMPKS